MNLYSLVTGLLFNLKISLRDSFLLLEMLERPYYMDYSHLRLFVHKIVTSKYFDLAISAVIGLNVITMAMEFYMMPLVLIKINIIKGGSLFPNSKDSQSGFLFLLKYAVC